MIPIPDYVKARLREYLLSVCPMAQDGWLYANQDEDTLTGDFFGRLRMATNRVENNYEWQFYYNKIRGRGTNALEKITGADGIITIVVHDSNTNSRYFKSITFQAKKTMALEMQILFSR